MKSTKSHRQTVFGPLQRKTFLATLTAVLRQHVPTLGQLTAQALAGHLDALIREYFPPIERLRMGQLLWFAVDRNETPARGKTIEETSLRPVVLSLFKAEDLDAYVSGVPKKEIREKVVMRLFDEAYAQGGVLTRADVAAIMALDTSTVSDYVLDYERRTQKTVPRRGTVHDIGPSVTHKRQICYQVLVLGRSIEETARATHHSPEAVARYVNDFKRVLHCLQAGLSIDQTAYVTRRSRRLVQEYADLQSELPKPGETRP
jgi:hypothetical protein